MFLRLLRRLLSIMRWRGDRSRECHERNCRFKSRDALLVRLSFRRTCDHRRVLLLRNEPVANHLDRHGPAIRELCNQRPGSRRLAQARTLAEVADLAGTRAVVSLLDNCHALGKS